MHLPMCDKVDVPTERQNETAVTQLVKLALGKA
jgi:hypothetical protein